MTTEGVTLDDCRRLYVIIAEMFDMTEALKDLNAKAEAHASLNKALSILRAQCAAHEYRKEQWETDIEDLRGAIKKAQEGKESLQKMVDSFVEANKAFGEVIGLLQQVIPLLR